MNKQVEWKRKIVEDYIKRYYDIQSNAVHMKVQKYYPVKV